MKDLKAEMYQMIITGETKLGKKPTKINVCLQNISRIGTRHPAFSTDTLWADSVSPQATTTASCEQFKPIRI